MRLTDDLEDRGGPLPGFGVPSRQEIAIARLEAERKARRGQAVLPAGGLWDEVAQKQQELF